MQKSWCVQLVPTEKVGLYTPSLHAGIHNSVRRYYCTDLPRIRSTAAGNCVWRSWSSLLDRRSEAWAAGPQTTAQRGVAHGQRMVTQEGMRLVAADGGPL